MGTNYYARVNTCSKCGRYEVAHIGKSSWGWPFALHVEPSDPDQPTSLDEWVGFIKDKDAKIFDEDNKEITLDKLLALIDAKSKNYSDRHKLEWGCIKNTGKCDLITGEFS